LKGLSLKVKLSFFQISVVKELVFVPSFGGDKSDIRPTDDYQITEIDGGSCLL